MGVYGYNLSNLNERMVLPMENTMENKFSNPPDTIPYPVPTTGTGSHPFRWTASLLNSYFSHLAAKKEITVEEISLAKPGAMIRASLCVPPNPGVIPSPASG